MNTALVRQPAIIHAAPRGAVWAADIAVAAYRLLQRVGGSYARNTLRQAPEQRETINRPRAAVLRSAEAYLDPQARQRA